MAGKAKFRIEGEDGTSAAWASAIGRGRAAANQLSGAFKSAFAGISVAAIAQVGRDAIKLGDDLDKAAKKAGIGGTAISELAYAAKLADIEIDALSTSIKKMQITLSQAASGGKAQIETLGALGLKIEEIKSLKADEQFELIADRISKLQAPADRARAAVEIFGKAGADLLPLFEQGAEGIRKARLEAEKLGYSFSDEQLKRLAGADESIKRLHASWQAFASTLAAKVAPTLSKILDDLSTGGGRRAQSFIAGSMFLGPVGAAINAFGGDVPGAGPAKRRTRRGPRSWRGATEVPGFTDTAAAEAALKAQLSAQKKFEEQQRDFNRDLGAELDQAFQGDLERQQKRFDMADDFQERQRENERELAEFRELQAEESANAVKGFFLSAFDDMVNTGKLHWKELLKYFLAELLRADLARAFDSWIGGMNKDGGGFLSKAVGWIGSAFGGAKAMGGPVNAGQTYLVGDGGPELLTMGSNGYITPNGAMGGGVVFNYSPRIDNRGSNADSDARLRTLMREQTRQIFDELDRKYGIA